MCLCACVQLRVSSPIEDDDAMTMAGPKKAQKPTMTIVTTDARHAIPAIADGIDDSALSRALFVSLSHTKPAIL